MNEIKFTNDEERQQYEAWRAKHADPEKAAHVAWLAAQYEWETAQRLQNELAELKEQMAAIGAGGVEPLRGSRQAHECREALAACINLLRKTPKITRDIYVGKDRQAWGVQAKAVLDAALAALNQKDEK